MLAEAGIPKEKQTFFVFSILNDGLIIKNFNLKVIR